ncbi:MAG: hypothetical protein Q9202_002168 [Teloschistes flavicans]
MRQSLYTSPEFRRLLTTDQNSHGFIDARTRPSTALRQPSKDAEYKGAQPLPSVHDVARYHEEEGPSDCTALEAGDTEIGVPWEADPRATNIVGPSTVIDALNMSREESDAFVSLARWERSPVRYPLDSFYKLWDWTRGFAQLYNGRIEGISQQVLHPESIANMLSGDREHLILSWKHLQSLFVRPQILFLWQDTMLWALEHDIDKALIFLDATITEPEQSITASRYAVEDAFKYIVSFYARQGSADSNTWTKLHSLFNSFATQCTMLHSLCEDFTREDTRHPLLKSFIAQSTHPIGLISPMSQKIIHLLLQHSDDAQTQDLYKTLSDSKTQLLPYTLTHFMDAFSRMGRADLAMDALEKIVASPYRYIRTLLEASCITLLRTRFDAVEWYRVQSRLATDIIELGIRPGMPMLNAMILNAFEASDYHTAQAIFEAAKIHGLRRNTITHSTLLKFAFRNLDESLVERIMYTAEEDGALPRNNRLVSCLVATLLQIGRSKSSRIGSSERAYKAMLRVYERYCEPGPLQELGIYIKSNDVVETTGEISPPSSQLVSTMIMGYIFLFGQLQDVVDLYHRWERHVANNHDIIAPTAATEYVANSFLICLGRHRSTFAMSLAILRNMLEPSISAVAKPNVYSWSIIADSFFRNRQPAAARRIIDMMRENGISPNQVTWHHIIAGHAGMQDASAAVEALREMEMAHFEVDSYTLKALMLVKDREQLLEALRRTSATVDDMENGEQDDAILTTYELSPGDDIGNRDGPVTSPIPPQMTKDGDKNFLNELGYAAYADDDRDFFGPHEKHFDNPESLKAVYPVRRSKPNLKTPSTKLDECDWLYDMDDTRSRAVSNTGPHLDP